MNHKFTNRLIKEDSPYLLQHAHNPVDWYPWGDEALEKAKKESKLIIVSVGYSACHWCHVMEHETFENIDAADVMNERFIAIKVDREERPDIDQVYMSAIQLITGRGGWPLNCILLPDGRPVWGGTYFRTEEWIAQINTIADYYEGQPDKVIDYANKLTNGIQQSDLVSMNQEPAIFDKKQIDKVYAIWSEQFDPIAGGLDKSPKFPLPNNYQFLLRYAQLSSNDHALAHVKLSLDKIAFGGIYDHLGGGITRYSTDKLWKVPHFEKMLYDNAQIVSLYSEAYQKFKDPVYKELVYETLNFVSRELTSEDGAFYSALDADSEQEEGKFYIWTKKELELVLGEDFHLFADYYNVNRKGYWERDRYILCRDLTDEEMAVRHKISIEELQNRISRSKLKLMPVREKRMKPGLDDKILTSWNALMMTGYTNAYLTFGEEHFLHIALKNATFILNHQLRNDGGLYHCYKTGKSSINGFLEDYAFTIESFLKLYEATLNDKWLKEANSLISYTLEHFYSHSSGMFFFTSDQDKALVARKTEVNDHVMPASNSTMAMNLFILSNHYNRTDLKDISRQMLHNVLGDVHQYPSGYSNWLNLLLCHCYPFYELVVVGNQANKIISQTHSNYVPNKLIAGSLKESKLPLLKNRFKKGQTLIFVCENKTCEMPTTQVDVAQKLMNIEL